MNFDGLDVTTGCEACKPCMRRNKCKDDCGEIAEDGCYCRTVCGECAASMAKVVDSVKLLRAEQMELVD